MISKNLFAVEQAGTNSDNYFSCEMNIRQHKK